MVAPQVCACGYIGCIELTFGFAETCVCSCSLVKRAGRNNDYAKVGRDKPTCKDDTLQNKHEGFIFNFQEVLRKVPHLLASV